MIFFFNFLWYQTTYQIMEEDILNYSPTVMFRGTPCIFLHTCFQILPLDGGVYCRQYPSETK